ncbi:protein Flattop [Megalops cyprinoides]|uniref:protein Flattop n=1 Tax=Megalops cyprinoides TaxID=118141 RepID=UPI0018649513|nr:protein Flattop [Megalops cyprinoides]
MATNFSANQYESAFKAKRLQNWTLPKEYKERPSAAVGHTTFIATDRGHLLPGVKAKRGFRSTFIGTWDLPRRIAPASINPTARSVEGQERLRSWSQDQGRSKRRSLEKGPESAPKSPENVETLAKPAEEDQVPEAASPRREASPTSPKPETAPTSPKPETAPTSPMSAASQSRPTSADQQEAIQAQ